VSSVSLVVLETEYEDESYGEDGLESLVALETEYDDESYGEDAALESLVALESEYEDESYGEDAADDDDGDVLAVEHLIVARECLLRPHVVIRAVTLALHRCFVPPEPV